MDEEESYSLDPAEFEEGLTPLDADKAARLAEQRRRLDASAKRERVLHASDFDCINLVHALGVTAVQLRGLADDVASALNLITSTAAGLTTVEQWVDDPRPPEEKVRALAWLLGQAEERERSYVARIEGLSALLDNASE